MINRSKTVKIFIICLAACLFSLTWVSCAPVVAIPSNLCHPDGCGYPGGDPCSDIRGNAGGGSTRHSYSKPHCHRNPTLHIYLRPPPRPFDHAHLHPPRVTILADSGCWYGPGFAYLFKYGLNATVWMGVYGRNMDGTWLNIRAPVDRPRTPAGSGPTWSGSTKGNSKMSRSFGRPCPMRPTSTSRRVPSAPPVPATK